MVTIKLLNGCNKLDTLRSLISVNLIVCAACSDKHASLQERGIHELSQLQLTKHQNKLGC
jgi:hypothetical protein